MPFVNLNSNIKYVIGIDFGHGETSAAIARLEAPFVVKDIDMGGGLRSIPSAILIRTDQGLTDTYIGKAAIDEFENKCNPKTDVFKCSFKNTPSNMSVKDREVMKAFFKEVYNTILSQKVYTDINNGNHCVVIACPSNTSKWTASELEQYVTMASDAGLPIVRYISDTLPGYIISGIVRESRAAYIKTQTDPDIKADITANIVHGGALAIDFGSSTVDLTYYNPQDSNIVDYGTIRDLGAQKVELLIYDYLSKVLDEDTHCKKYEILENIKNIVYCDFNHPNYNTYFNAYTSILLSIREQKEKYYQKGAKNGLKINIDLNDATKGLHKDLINFRISSQELDTLLSHYCDEIRRDFIHFKEVYLNDRDVSILIMTGGASRMGFVRQIANEVFCPSATKFDNDPELSISHGVAVAGQADILVVRMLEDLLADDKINNARIWSGVKDEIVKSLAQDIIGNMEYRYDRLKKGLIKTINSVDEELNRYISNLNWAGFVNSAYSMILTNYINDKVHQNILAIMSKFFPTSPQDRISKIDTNNRFSISVDTQNLSAINASISDSIKQIEEGFLLAAFKTLINLGILAGDFLLVVADAVYDKVEDGLRALWGALGGKKWEKVYGKYEFGDLSEKALIEYRDKDTELNDSQRSEVYSNFTAHKNEYKSKLEKDIKTALANAIEADVDEAARKAIKDYILNSISKVRLLLN